MKENRVGALIDDRGEEQFGGILPVHRHRLVQIAAARVDLERAEAAARKTAAVPVPGEFLFSAREAEKQRELLALQREHLSRTEKLAEGGSASLVDLMNLRMQLLVSEARLARDERAAALAAGDYGQSAVAEARAVRDLAAAKLAALETRRAGLLATRARFEIRAPRSGVVSATATLYPSLSVGAGQPLLKIADTGKTVLRLRASEDRIAELRIGQRVRFRTHSNPDRLAPYATARVAKITPERELTATDVAGDYFVEADHLSAPYPLPAGARVDAEVVLRSRSFFSRWFIRSDQGSSL